MDLSFPPGQAVNDGISKVFYQGQEFKLKYPSVDDLVKLVRLKGKGSMLFKVDLKSAFCQLPVDPGDIHLLSYVWKGHIYMDKVMAMGCRSAAMCCQRLTDAISYVFYNMGYACVNYLDDFGGVDTYINAGRAYNGLRLLLSRLGIVVSENKCSAPNQSMVFLGVLAIKLFPLSI